MARLEGVATDSAGFSKELNALASVLKALSPLEEKAREFVIRTVVDRLNIVKTAIDPKKDQLNGSSSGRNGTSLTDSLEGIEPRRFLALKKPRTELERIVCLAYYLTHARSTPYFKTSDLTALNTEAAGGRFSNPSVTVNNATIQSRFFAPAGKEGKKQLTPLGEDYVRALPDFEAAKTVVASNRPVRRKLSRKKHKPKE
jgi:hypothetical protein